MLYLDMPDAAPVAVYASVAEPATRSAMDAARTDGICTFMAMNAKDNPRPMAQLMGYAVHTIDLLPKDLVDRVMVGKGAWRSEDDRWYGNWSDSLDIEILRPPKHGEMVIQDDLDIYPSYLPAKGYIGKDRVDVLVRAKDLEGRPIAKKLVYFINVIPRKESEDIDRYKALSQKYCAGRERWRISGDSPLFGTISGNFVSERLAMGSNIWDCRASKRVSVHNYPETAQWRCFNFFASASVP